MSEGQVYVIIGASGGIGSSVARELAGEGASLVLAGRNRERLNKLSDELDTEAETVVTDASDYESVESLFKAAKDRFGRIDGVVNCAGSILIKPAHLTTVDEFVSTIETNLSSAFFVVKAGARAMMKDGGAIVLVASAVATAGLANHEAIAAAKGGVAALARSAAATYANRDLRVNAVAPGLVETGLTTRITENEAGRKASESMHALGRLGKPEDVASAICWLLDRERSGWVTGQVLGVDGGLGSVRPR